MLDIETVSALSSIPPQILRNHIASGLIVPTSPGGRGRGLGHRFSPTQAVGIIIAAKLHNDSERSCSVSYVTKVVEAFTQVSEDWLRKQFTGRRTHFVMVHQGMPILGGKAYDWIDVRAAYEAVVSTNGRE